MKLETQRAYHNSDAMDLVIEKSDGGSTPEVRLKPEAHQRPFTLKTCLAQVAEEPNLRNVAYSGRSILVRVGTLVIPDIEEFFDETGIDLSCLASFDLGQGRMYAGTVAVDCHFKHAVKERCDGGSTPEVTTQGTTELLQALQTGVAIPKLWQGTAPSEAHSATAELGPPRAAEKWQSANWWSKGWDWSEWNQPSQ